ncbi:MAG: hypothetical protein ACK5QY_16815 [Pseudanabaena sp.]
MQTKTKKKPANCVRFFIFGIGWRFLFYKPRRVAALGPATLLEVLQQLPT